MSDQTTEAQISILVIDDELAIGDALRLVIESAGFEVVVVDKGLDGIRMATVRLCLKS